MNFDSRIFVAGHQGLVGSAICRRLTGDGFSNLLLRTRDELDLRNQQAVDGFFAVEKPEYVFLAAAKVGGILANSTYPAEFIRDKISLCRPISFIQPGSMVRKSFCSWDLHAFIPDWHRSRSGKSLCSLARWNPPTNGMRWPRSRG